MRNKILYLIPVLLLVCSLPAKSQKLVNSPYSRFNLGKLEQRGSFRSAGMGGVGIALKDNNSVQFSNPSSYSSFDTLAFIFDFGLDYSKNVLTDGQSHYFSDDMNFHHFIIGFPISKGWGVAAGVVPFSSGYYSLKGQTTTEDPDYDPITGETYSTHKGTGGYNSLFLGTGLSITENFSVGANMNVLFGQIKRENQVTLLADNFLFNNTYNETLLLKGINFDYGIQYSGKLKGGQFINVGVSHTLGKNYTSNYEILNMRSSLFYTSAYSPDTITYENNKNLKVFLPQTFRIGVAFGKKDLFTAGVDYLKTNWTKATIPGSTGYLADSESLRFGLEYTPKKYTSTSYLSAIDYRLGSHIENSYLLINGSQLKEYGITFGFGLPMLGTISKANLYFDYTKRHGPSAGSLPEENVYSVGISLNMYDYWFIKRKYD